MFSLGITQSTKKRKEKGKFGVPDCRRKNENVFSFDSFVKTWRYAQKGFTFTYLCETRLLKTPQNEEKVI